MAGAGYKQFADGDVLTAAQVQTYLQDQAVMKFADSSARTTGLGTAVAEGMVSYLADTDAVEVYDGSAWTSVGESRGLVAVKTAITTSTQTNSTAAGGSFDITGLSITHAVADAAHKVILMGYTVAGTDYGRSSVGCAFYDGSSLLGLGNANGNRTRVAVAKTDDAKDNNNYGVANLSLHLVHTPGSTSSVTYTMRAINVGTGTNTVTINRPSANDDAAYTPAASSVLTLMEVRV